MTSNQTPSDVIASVLSLGLPKTQANGILNNLLDFKSGTKATKLPNALSADRYDARIASMIKGGSSVEEVALTLNVSVTTVYTRIKAAGITYRVRRNRLTPTTIDQILEAGLNTDLSLREIAVGVGTSSTSVRVVLRGNHQIMTDDQLELALTIADIRDDI